MLKKSLLRVGLALPFVLLLALTALIEMAFPYYGIKPLRRDWGVQPYSHAVPFEATTSDSIVLKGYILPADSAKGTLVMLHGISACKDVFWNFSERVNRQRCNAVIFDQRAHGNSGGEYCTFGAKEKYDVSAILDELERRGLAKPYGIFGNSLGGAIALQALAYDKRLQFGIIESTFDTYPHVALEYGADITGFKSTVLTDHVISRSGSIAGFDPFAIRPVDACRSITCPMLIAHGTADDKIPIEFGKSNFDALASADKTFYAVEGGTHNRLFRHSENGWPRRIEDFLKKQLSR
jgi:pimeloyl-ACP methyl ester carboxylesterase